MSRKVIIWGNRNLSVSLRSCKVVAHYSCEKINPKANNNNKNKKDNKRTVPHYDGVGNLE